MNGTHDPVWDRWDEVDRLFARLLEIDAPERDRRLAELCGGDEDLERALRDLLAASDSDASFDAGPRPGLLRAALDDARLRHEPSGGVPQHVGPYRILEPIGRGGMGSVYLAERADPAFPQRVAVKVLRRGIDTDDVVARFIAERQILASLHHPAIATVFDAGATADGRPYLVMEYVRGRTITDHCDAARLDLRSRLRLFAAVTRAVAHAHERGVVHRDLKPSNILVTADEGHVKLLDFGIAKMLDPDARADHSPPTRPGTRLLTPGFASPEQIQGLAVSERSDVYQLGLLLCELLTGQRPFETGPASHDRHAPARFEPEPPSRLVRSRPDPRSAARARRLAAATARASDPRRLARLLGGDLDAIVLKALRTDPADRYASASELHDDLVRYLDGLPVAARRGAAAYRLGKAVRRRLAPLAPAALTALGTGLVLLLVANRPGTGNTDGRGVRWIATAGVIDETGSAGSRLAHQISELLATDLGRLPGLQVVALHAALFAVPCGPTPGSDTTRSPASDACAGTHVVAAARQAGAAEVVVGAIRNPAPGELELVLRRVRTSTGAAIDSVRVRGADAFALVDAATAALAAQLGIGVNSAGVAGVTTVDPEAYRLYVEGLAAFGTGDDRVADRFFRAALAQDSTFAMAAYYAFRTTAGYDRDGALQLLNRAHRLAERASDRERLVIRARFAEYMHDPATTAVADTLVARYPADPDGHYLRARALYVAGDFLGAVPHFERAIQLDSLSLHAQRAACVACDALLGLETTYEKADSLHAAERTARRWLALQPTAARAWHTLASDLVHLGRFDEAIQARTRAASLRVGNLDDPLFAGIVEIHRGDFAEADATFRRHSRNGTRAARREALWSLAISLRHQGRFAEALRAAEGFQEASRPEVPDDWWDLPGRSLRAQVLFEMGRFREAADLFLSAQRPYAEYAESRQARADAWLFTHVGTARAAAGDTVGFAAFADTLEAIGTRSLYGRDQRLHHYLRALLARARGASEPEIEAHLRAALYSLPNGYSRINLELGQSLMRQGRHAEAASVLGAALRNSAESNGLYATRTEFHALLGEAWDAAGRADSATLHYRAAVNGWRRADPVLRHRVLAIERRLQTLAADRS
jgi:serine/threonine protein kinase/Flp pilus assembly protein TadD